MMSALEGKADVPVLQRARKKALRVKNPETGTYPGCSAYSCRSLQPQISRKVRKFPRHFKGHFSIGNVQVRILPGQPGSPVLGVIVPDTRRNGPPMAGLCNSASGLWAPKFAKCEANSPKVSRHYHEYSRFPETD